MRRGKPTQNTGRESAHPPGRLQESPSARDSKHSATDGRKVRDLLQGTKKQNDTQP